MDIHQIFVVFHVPEEEFNRLLSKSDTDSNNYRPTRILYCVVWLSEVELYYICECHFDLFGLAIQSVIF